MLRLSLHSSKLNTSSPSRTTPSRSPTFRASSKNDGPNYPSELVQWASNTSLFSHALSSLRSLWGVSPFFNPIFLHHLAHHYFSFYFPFRISTSNRTIPPGFCLPEYERLPATSHLTLPPTQSFLFFFLQ